MDIKIQELSDKVLVITFPNLFNEDARNLLRQDFENLGFKIIWLVA